VGIRGEQMVARGEVLPGLKQVLGLPDPRSAWRLLIKECAFLAEGPARPREPFDG
jgi:hypothetical protein